MRLSTVLLFCALVGAALAGCATTDTTTGLCLTCDSGYYGADCQSTWRFTVEGQNILWDEYAICMVGVALVLKMFTIQAYCYHFVLHAQDPSDDTADDTKPDSSGATEPTATEAESAAENGTATEERTDETAEGGAEAVKEEEEEEVDDDGVPISQSKRTLAERRKGAQGNGTHAVNVAEDGEEATAEELAEEQSIAVNANGTKEEKQETTNGNASDTHVVDVAPADESSSKETEQNGAAHEPRDGEPVHSTMPVGRAGRDRSIRSRSTFRDVWAMQTVNDDVSVSLPRTNDTATTGRGHRGRSVSPSQQHQHVVLPPPAPRSGRSMTRQLPPTQNPIHDPITDFLQTSPSRAMSTATDMSYRQSMMRNSVTPVAPRSTATAGRGNSIMTVECARPANFSIDEADERGIRFNVQFTDGAGNGQATPPPYASTPTGNAAPLGTRTPPAAPVEPQKPSAANAAHGNSVEASSAPLVETLPLSPEQQQERQQDDAAPVEAREAPVESNESQPVAAQSEPAQEEAPAQPTGTASAPRAAPPVEEHDEEDATPPPPRFRKGDVIRRNALEPEAVCDFGGFVGAMLCGEVACVQAVGWVATSPKTGYYAYHVVGGDRAAEADVDTLFTRVSEN